jgi:hypothetical protein
MAVKGGLCFGLQNIIQKCLPQLTVPSSSLKPASNSRVKILGSPYSVFRLKDEAGLIDTVGPKQLAIKRSTAIP